MLQVFSNGILATLSGVYLHLLQRKKLRQGSSGYLSCQKSYIHTCNLGQHRIKGGKGKEKERMKKKVSDSFSNPPRKC